ncbi:MAG: CocE/NonD family hydrolase, partial [Alphaproteobacteria bacterium]
MTKRRNSPPTVRTDFPHRIREVPHLWIPLADGTRLAARLWLPEDAGPDSRVPVVMEYIPYRKRDFTAGRDEAMHPYWASHGYAAIRVDLRGSGESDGVMLDEYVKQEQDDALEVIAWLAAQPWSSGSVGMMGKSWGGFNVLQVAARRPPALKAIISVYSTVDRYADDIHFMGGCLLESNLGWADTMFAYNARPPDPDLAGAGWRTRWFERLEAGAPWVLEWLAHQHRDDFWRHGSVCEDYGAIETPCYAVGGWSDAYTNAVFELLANLKGPRQGIIGPWGHQYPHQAWPKPDYGFLQDALLWWDHWLKGEANGVMDRPMLRAWMEDWTEPRAVQLERPGRWVAEPAWPIPQAASRTLHLNTDGLGDRPAAGPPLVLPPAQTVGLTCLNWCAHGDDGPEHPEDQRPDDARSLVFDSAPLDEPLEILGAPTISLTVAADRPVAMVVVRLMDVAPDGRALRVTWSPFNLTHRDSRSRPQALTPGEAVTVRFDLKNAGHRFPAGHRIRVAVSASYWPIVVPSPQPVTLTVTPGEGSLDLPVRRPSAADKRLADLPPAEHAALAPRRQMTPRRNRPLAVERDVASGRVTIRSGSDTGLVQLSDGWVFGEDSWRELSITDERTDSARSEYWTTMRFERGDWSVRTVTRSLMTSDATHFHIK